MAYSDVPVIHSAQPQYDMTQAQFATVPYWSKYSFAHTDLQISSMFNTIPIFTLPAATTIEKIIIKPTVAFAGTVTYTLSVGTAGSVAKYVAIYDAKQAVSGTAFGIMAVTLNYGLESFTSATPIVLSAVSTIVPLSSSTAGAVDVYVRTSTLNQ